MVNSQPVRSSNPAVNVLKNVGASPLFLVATILYSAGILGSIIASFFVRSDLSNILYMMYQMGLDVSPVMPYIDQVLEASRSSSVITAILGAIPTILIALGMWMTWASCRDMRSGNVTTTGLTVCRVILMIYRVLVIIGMVLVAIGGVVMLVGGVSLGGRGSGYGYAGVGLAVVAVLMLFVGVGLLVLLLCFYNSAIRAVTRIRETARTGVPDNRISMFLIVMIWIMAVLAVISGLSSMAISPAAGLVGVLQAVASILVAICLKKYRDQMTALTPAPAAPGYGQPYGGIPQQPYPQGYQPQQPYPQGYQPQPYQAPQQPYQAPQQAPYQVPQQPVQQPYQAPSAPQQPPYGAPQQTPGQQDDSTPRL